MGATSPGILYVLAVFVVVIALVTYYIERRYRLGYRSVRSQGEQMTSHPYLQRHTQRTRLLWLLVVACIIGAALLVWTAESAGAHQATLSVTTKCQQDGLWVAEWRLTNDQPRKQMTVEAQDVTGFASPVGYLGTGRDSTVHANTVSQVTARVTVDWLGVNPQQVEATAMRPEACQQPTTTTVPPVTSTTLPPVGLIAPLVIERPRSAVPVSAEVTFTG